MGIFNKQKSPADNKKSPVEEKNPAPSAMKDLYAGQPKKAGATNVRRGDVGQLLVLKKPQITEKAGNLGVLNQYVFVVDIKANKITIAKAVKAIYGVKPTAVRIIRCQGKTKRYGRTIGRRKDWKKAIVSLPAGKTINLYEGV